MDGAAAGGGDPNRRRLTLLTAAEVNDRVAALLRRCLTAHGGSLDPSRISRAALRQQPGEEAVYSQLNKLLLPGGLRPFVESHPEFSWTTHGQKGMLITWALGAEPAAASGLEQPAPRGALHAPLGRRGRTGVRRRRLTRVYNCRGSG